MAQRKAVDGFLSSEELKSIGRRKPRAATPDRPAAPTLDTEKLESLMKQLKPAATGEGKPSGGKAPARRITPRLEKTAFVDAQEQKVTLSPPPLQDTAAAQALAKRSKGLLGEDD